MANRSPVYFFKVLLSIVVLFIFVPQFVFSQDQGENNTKNKIEVEHRNKLGVDFAYYPDDHEGYNAQNHWLSPSYTPVQIPGSFVPIGADNGRVLGSGWGAVEARVFLDHDIVYPFLVGDNALTEGNNLTFSGMVELTPVTLAGEVAIVWTPVAFFNLEVGATAGSGWDIGFANGVGLNENGTIQTKSFPGIYGNIWVGATLQFDLAAVFPSDWTHIMMMANARFHYRGFSAAGNDDPWMWQMDRGENYNGWQYRGSYFLGYQIPPMVTVGVLVDTKENLGYNRSRSTIESRGWGSDFVFVEFAPVVNIDFNENHTMMILAQFKNERVYTDSTVQYKDFRNRTYQDWYIELSRIVVCYRFSF